MARIRIDDEEHQFNGTILDCVLSLGKNPDSYLFLCDGKPVPVDSVPVTDVNAIRVASGG